LDHNPEAKDGMYWIDLGGIYPKQVSFQNCMINVKVNFESNANVVSKFSTYALFVLKFAQFDEARERTSVSWMHNPCSGHVDSSQICGPASDWTVLDLNNL
jgi:hypothetical protein